MSSYVGQEQTYRNGKLEYDGVLWEKHDTYLTLGEAIKAGEKLEDKGYVTIVSAPYHFHNHTNNDDFRYYLWKRRLSK